ncbi:Uu.00g113270.m01.CDS01 [Anthostomella pinea]|uniref:Uu.00g113270.m01.CDS01 n=1 Tax=Anthostomella pinea TaxID=933095 RepID=A0AAI8VFG6_9PEZI|nr:Uu.00g113270.m01.CDS01 [Anthostomella pinea]
MDFSHTYYGAAQAAPYHFIGIPPLTPSHSNSAASDEFNNHSPHEVYENFQNNDAFQQNFDQYGQFNNQTQSFPGPPGPPTPPTHPLHGQHAAQVNGAQPVKNHSAELLPSAKPDPDGNRGQAGSNSDDDGDMTPAQSRRKAQNRAAQRAFRERKERHVKDLEAKLASLEAAQTHTATENEKLKRDLQKMSTENEILRATSSVATNHKGNGSMSPPGGIPTTTGPMQYNPTDFYSDLLQNHANKTPSHRIVESSGGERLLAAGATWDYITGHELFRKGMVDVGDVSERLKSQAKCDGQGPVFEERAILQAIVESVSGSDELL